MMKKIIMLLTGLICLISANLWAQPTKTIVINKETADFVQDIKYPQGFTTPSIDSQIKQFIETTQKDWSNQPVDSSTPADLPGKNGLSINYEIKYQTKKTLSLVFYVSTFARGAAHPNNSVVTFNFVDGKELTLDQLFKKDSGYLAFLAKKSRELLAKKSFSDKEWVAKGTEPRPENYKKWYLTKKGLTLIFDTYQVAAYVYGPQELTIKKVEIKPLLKPELFSAVWGNE